MKEPSEPFPESFSAVLSHSHNATTTNIRSVSSQSMELSKCISMRGFCTSIISFSLTVYGTLRKQSAYRSTSWFTLPLRIMPTRATICVFIFYLLIWTHTDTQSPKVVFVWWVPKLRLKNYIMTEKNLLNMFLGPLFGGIRNKLCIYIAA